MYLPEHFVWMYLNVRENLSRSSLEICNIFQKFLKYFNVIIAVKARSAYIFIITSGKIKSNIKFLAMLEVEFSTHYVMSNSVTESKEITAEIREFVVWFLALKSHQWKDTQTVMVYYNQFSPNNGIDELYPVVVTQCPVTHVLY